MFDYEKLARGGLLRLKPYQAGKPIEEVQRELGLSEVIKLASNENPLGMSPKALEAAQRSLPGCNFYPDANGFYLKRKLEEKFGYAPETLTLGAGSNELINLIFQALMGPECNVVLPEYSFIVYPMEAQVNEAPVKVVPLKDWVTDTAGLLAAVDERTRAVVLANPSNPVGTAVSSGKLKTLLKGLPERTLLIIDEAYNEFNRDDPEFEDTALWLKDYPNLVVSRTFSKAYGLAGLRVGYMVTNPQISSLLNRLRAPFNVNSVALAAAVAALDDTEFLERAVHNNTVERARYESFCAAHGLKLIPSKANFVAIDFAPRDAQRIARQLLEGGVIVRPLLGYRMKDILRVSIGTPEQNDRFFRTLEEILRA